MTWELIFVEQGGLVKALTGIQWPCVKPYSRGITNYLYPAVKRKTGLTALTTAAVSPRVQRHELCVSSPEELSGARGTTSR